MVDNNKNNIAENKQFQEEVRRLHQLSALHEISKSMHTLNLPEILHLILEGVTKAIGFDRARLYLINEKGNKLECKIAVGIEKEIKDIYLPLDKENSMVARAVIEKQPFIIENAYQDPRVNKYLKELFGLKSFAVVPLIGRDKVMGAITADNLVSDRTINVEEFESLVTFTNQASLALENAKMYEELKSFNLKLEDMIKQAMDDLRRTQGILIQSEKLAALGKLSAGIAHEIRNPLTSIKLLINSLEKADKQKREEDLRVIAEEIKRVEILIKRFLEFAKPTAPQFTLVDINSILEETINLITGEMKEHNIILEKNFDILPKISADKEQMKQVFINLLLNAFQSMPEGGKTEIRTYVKEGTILVEIKDEGSGIHPSVKDKLFEPFFTTKEEGIGLGLSITKRIIDEHKGSIEIKDNSPRGTIFTIKLPILKSRK